MESFFLNRTSAEEFLDLYQVVLPDFTQSVDQLVSGPCIAMEIRQQDCVQSFKKLCGSYDPNVGRSKGETQTLRSLYGQDRHRNAVHCSDIGDEGPIECEFFFVLLPEKKQ